MKYFGSVRTKALFWLLGAIAACCATIWHFVYGNSVWALTDIPFLVLFIIAFFETVRGARRPKEPSVGQSNGEDSGHNTQDNNRE
jgi:hypothetical protein